MESTYNVVSRLNGGLGNQIFQLAAGLFVASREGRTLVLDESGISHLNARNLHTSRTMMIDILFPSVNVRDLSRSETTKCSAVRVYAHEGASPMTTLTARLLGKSEKMTHEKRYLLEGYSCEDLFDVKVHRNQDAYLSGYWQDFRYADAVRDKLLETYSTGDNFLKPNSKLAGLAKGLREHNAAAMHVRRSDFIEKYSKQKSVTSLAYFKKAIQYFENRGVSNFYVFSDDVSWCVENFATNKGITFPGLFCSNDAEELWLMSQGVNFITSNSSYSWWAAWISGSPEKSIIRPRAWTTTDPGFRVYPPDWIALE